jgi:hypothetical protein
MNVQSVINEALGAAMADADMNGDDGCYYEGIMQDLERRRRTDVQLRRIESTIASMRPGLVVIPDAFQDDRLTIKFRVESADEHTPIIESGKLNLVELENSSEPKLRELLVDLSAGRL